MELSEVQEGIRDAETAAKVCNAKFYIFSKISSTFPSVN